MKPIRVVKLLYIFYIKKNKIISKAGFPKVMGIEETLEEIINNNYSIARYGDGEFNLILGRGNGLQNSDNDLAIKLKKILEAGHTKQCKIGFPDVFYRNSNNKMKLIPSLVWSELLLGFYPSIKEMIEHDAVYYNSFITRPYMDFIKVNSADKIFTTFKRHFENKKVLIVEGEGTKFGSGNSLIEWASSIDRIITVNRNAFKFYEEIYNEVMNVINRYDIVLVALGPTATVLTYDISLKSKKQVIDIGHLDIEYEWFIKQSKKKVVIPNKAVNELGVNSVEYKGGDGVYLSSIISKVGLNNV